MSAAGTPRNSMGRRYGSPVMGSPDEPKPPAGSAAAMAHRDMRKRYGTIGMHAPAGQARPARGGMTAREMVSLLLFLSCLCIARV
eukprot:COSAG03_NODE_11107_length_611_cov_0.732422_1_plen_84_part_10